MGSLQRFTAWCIQVGWREWWYRWDLSVCSTAYFGAIQGNRQTVIAWSQPLVEAFIAGAWILNWTEDTLYWVAKPVVSVEHLDNSGSRRLHCAEGPALDSDVENLYFWHGVLVPAFVVVRPGWITVQHITSEDNAEVRRCMLERMGAERFTKEAQMTVIHEDSLTSRFASIPVGDEIEPGKRFVVSYRKGEEKARLLRCDAVTDGDGRPLKFIHVICPSTSREYYLRVRHDIMRAYEGVASTFNMTEEQYKTGSYLRQGDVMLRAAGKQGFQQHS